MRIIDRIVVSCVLAVCVTAGAAHAEPSTDPPGPAGELYLPEVQSDTVAVIDTATNTVQRRIPTGPATRPGVLTATPDGRKIYTDNFGFTPPSVTIIDRPSNTTKSVPIESPPLGIFTSNDGREVYLPEIGFVIEVLDVATDTIVRRFRFPDLAAGRIPDVPAGAIQGPDGLLYVGFMGSGIIEAIDPISGVVARPPLILGGIGTFWYSFSKDGSKLYANSDNSISVIDLREWRVAKLIHTGWDGDYHLSNPGAFVSTLTPDGGKLYVTVFGGKDVLVVDTAKDEVIGRIPTSGAATAVVFSEDGSRGYITDMGPSSNAYPGPILDPVLFGNLVTAGIGLTPGQVLQFDPHTDRLVGEPIPVRVGPGVPLWFPPLPTK
ncbi:YncE family protein [Nocardia pseudobrasiliensis]|uniref:YVTN family beta-propeller protein n=1 Tax=Nocardia pseudobrasiliensis TaxID=45979 RepID=A0A370IBC8_9NOCA|nr:YncE family protein [Nocardia pseudobrasiliensis]RDI68036.1 YVTN family beta-propeller protein [Nocardia pseudobrasiliensis]